MCTTELGYAPTLQPEFDKRQTKMIGLSVEPASNHESWEKDIEQAQGFGSKFPMIGNTDLQV